MTPEEKELLKRAVALSEENNEMLRYLHRSAKIGRFMTIAYWVLIIGSAVGAFYLIQPYIDYITGNKGSSGGSSLYTDILKGL